ncbi:hypothetical protein CALVIDRAFT_322456 [Calocera viscosa TUFC12733]|uniref:Enoyl reductase (ER) domain-containing protein n=1 Tax=Calocera viscosa (strain TUFC12733) TaxID=1330018 RepID=A0A167QP79_CALVF|nr:hypothetical protein CALVIDRAFT_322456 [Calocera viscosa TUFC12733]
MPRPTFLQNVLGRPTRSYNTNTNTAVEPAYVYNVPRSAAPRDDWVWTGTGWEAAGDAGMGEGRVPREPEMRLEEMTGKDVILHPPKAEEWHAPLSLSPPVQQRQREPAPPQQQQQQKETSDSDADTDVFFTPPQSPSPSPRQSLFNPETSSSNSNMLALPPSLLGLPHELTHPDRPKPHLPPQHARIHSVRPSSPDLALSSSSAAPPHAVPTPLTASTATTASSDAYSNYSWSFSASTATTPSPAISRNPSVSKVSRSSLSPSQEPAQAWPPSAAAVTQQPHRPATPETESRKRRRPSSGAPRTQPPEWAKDVKWLVSPLEQEQEQARKSQAREARVKRASNPEKSDTGERRGRRRAAAGSAQGSSTTASSSTLTRSVSLSVSGSSSTVSRSAAASSSGGLTRHASLRSQPTDPDIPEEAAATLLPQPTPRPRPRALSLRIAQLRMSDVPELDESAPASAGSAQDLLFPSVSMPNASSAPSVAASTTSRRSRSTQDHTHTLTGPPTLRGAPAAPSARQRTSSAPSRPASSYSTTTHSNSNTVVLPTPLPIPAPSDASTQQGYTSLTLPHASYVPSDPFKAATQGRVDVARLGIGQAAMATVSVIRGAARSGVFRRRSLSLTRSDTRASGAQQQHALAFSVRTPPPSRVPPSSALVRVYACALDSLDALLLRSKLTEGDAAFGYIPGRAFVGHVVEAGWDCPGVSKHDWVIGLLEVKHPCALAEFVLVDRRRLHRCPRPSDALSLDQLAVLALSGLPAHRASRTASELPREARVLVLLGACAALACSPGALCARMLVAQGFAVSIQIQGEAHAEAVSRVCEADEVWEGEVLRCLSSLGEHVAAEGSEGEGERFDLVVDCVGGREVWRAARGVLKDGGQFTTLVGDAPDSAPTLRASIHSNLRSLRRAFLTPSSGTGNPGASALSVATTKSKVEKAKRIEYEWVSPLHAVDREGEDVRDSLEAVVKSAEEGVGVPFLSLSEDGMEDGAELDGVEVVTMEKAAEAIERLDTNGGIVIVKVVG